MMHNLVNRALTPEHRVLEEDWRAYRAMMHNWQNAQRRVMTEDERRAAFIRDRQLAVKVVGFNINKNDLMDHIASLSICTSNLATHKPAMEGPPGYLYERFMQDQKLNEQRMTDALTNEGSAEAGKRLLRLPLLEIDDPFGKLHITTEARQLWRPPAPRPSGRDYDVMATRVAGIPERALVYNEPDNLPCHLVQENFAELLTERAERSLTSVAPANSPTPQVRKRSSHTSLGRRRSSKGNRSPSGGKRVSPRASKQKAAARKG